MGEPGNEGRESKGKKATKKKKRLSKRQRQKKRRQQEKQEKRSGQIGSATTSEVEREFLAIIDETAETVAASSAASMSPKSKNLNLDSSCAPPSSDSNAPTNEALRKQVEADSDSIPQEVVRKIASHRRVGPARARLIDDDDASDDEAPTSSQHELSPRSFIDRRNLYGWSGRVSAADSRSTASALEVRVP